MGKEGESVIAKLAAEFNFTIHDILRYAMSGTVGLLVLACAVLRPGGGAPGAAAGAKAENLQAVATFLGVPGLTLVAVSFGVILYIVVRQTLIPLVACWCVNKMPLGCIFGDRWKLRNEVINRKFREILNETTKSLTFYECETVFFVLRTHRDGSDKPLWPESVQNQLFKGHSESHLVFASALSFLIAIFVRCAIGMGFSWWFFGGFVLFVLCGGLCDVILFMREGALISKVDKEVVERVLRSAGLEFPVAKVEVEPRKE